MAKKSSTEVSEERVAFKGGKGVVQRSEPYLAEVELVGADPILFHRYDVENAQSVASAKKGAKEKKTDNLEAYVYRNADGDIVFPAINFKSCLSEAAKSKQDPRSPRKSLRDLLRAGIKVVNDASFGVKDWDYVDTRPARIQRNGIIRSRPALKAGWKLTYQIRVILPEYIAPELLHDLCVDAGRLMGLGDFRPDFGTFRVTRFENLSVAEAAA